MLPKPNMWKIFPKTLCFVPRLLLIEEEHSQDRGMLGPSVPGMGIKLGISFCLAPVCSREPTVPCEKPRLQCCRT